MERYRRQVVVELRRAVRVISTQRLVNAYRLGASSVIIFVVVNSAMTLLLLLLLLMLLMLVMMTTIA